jgi:hypothetical protein
MDVLLKSSTKTWKSEFFRFYLIISSLDPHPDPDSLKSPDPDPKHRFLTGQIFATLGDTGTVY